MKTNPLLILALGAVLATAARAHDTWLQTNTAISRSGDAVYVDFLLGNHGNDHRDFKLAGKPSLEGSTVEIIGPDGAVFDLKPSLVDRGYAPKEGFWSAKFEPTKPGLYLAVQTSDQVASYAPERIVRNAKTFFLVSASLDRVSPDVPGYARVSGAGLELVPEANPVVPMGVGVPIKVRLLFRAKPLAHEKVSFIPQGQSLAEGFDSRYERQTDESGSATFEPKDANYYLIVAHHIDPDGKGPNYKSTNYSATLVIIVPALCPCCGE
jgi:uncharacterized GH25 family protein